MKFEELDQYLGYDFVNENVMGLIFFWEYFVIRLGGVEECYINQWDVDLVYYWYRVFFYDFV